LKRLQHLWLLWLPGKQLLGTSIGTISGHAPWMDRLVIFANKNLPDS